MTFPLVFSVISLFGVFFIFSIKMMEIKGRIFSFWNRIRFYSDLVYDFGTSIFQRLIEGSKEVGKSAFVTWFSKIGRLIAHWMECLAHNVLNLRDILRAKIHITVRRHKDNQ